MRRRYTFFIHHTLIVRFSLYGFDFENQLQMNVRRKLGIDIVIPVKLYNFNETAPKTKVCYLMRIIVV